MLRLQWVHWERATLLQWGARLGDSKLSGPGGHLATLLKEPENKAQKGGSTAQRWREADCWCDTEFVFFELRFFHRTWPSQGPGHDGLIFQASATCSSISPSWNELCSQALKRLSAGLLWRNKYLFWLPKNRLGSQETEAELIKSCQNPLSQLQRASGMRC